MQISLIFILLLAACTTEPVEIHDDNAVLHTLLSMGADTLEIQDCVDFPDSVCIWEEDRITLLNLFNMGLNGNIPDEIENLTELTQLGLKSNNLSGAIPESIGNLANLTQLSLSNNILNGSLPISMGNLTKLTLLDLSNNNFEGSIPSSIGELSSLYTLLVDSNSFSGSIPKGLCNIENLEISNNQFCPPQPSCINTPDDIGFQNCDTSCGSGNRYLNGYCYSQSDLDVLQDLINNANSLNMIMDTDTIYGVQPLELGFQEWQSGRLKTLDCDWDTVNCHLSTEFPLNIINLDSLKYLDLQNNAITGAIPDEIGNLSALENLNLQDNNLSGYLPESLCIDDITIWTDINLKNNRFCPCYPECLTEDDIGGQDTSECSYCIDGYTQICDKHPGTISFLKTEEGIIIGDSLCFNTNNLTVLEAFIDSSLASFPDSLDISMLSDTTASIDELDPLELGEQIWANGKLFSFDASNRGLSGGIPPNIGNLDSLFYLIISDNYLSGELPSNIFTLTSLYSLHLSGNQLSGEILPAICMMLDNWEIDGFNPNRSYLDKNNFCPSEDGYPECILPFVGEQNTTGCE